MTLTEWRDHLEILGPDLSVWPKGLAEAGLDLMAQSTAAQDMFARASQTQGLSPTEEARAAIVSRPA